MCGRIVHTTANTALAALFRAVPGNDLPSGPNYNVCPTNMLPVVTGADDAGQRRLRAMRWGFLPGWYKAVNDGPLIINARSETVASKPAFRDAVRQRRCIVPVTGFYEWQAGENSARLPWYFTRRDGAPMALAGLWQRWNDIDTLAIVSTEAGPGMRGLHHREPVILEQQDWPLWLGEAGHGAAVLMRASAADVMQCHRVGTAVNTNRASGPQLIEPVAAP
ncbi:MAG: SOS response-associated peptidase [Rhodobacteraceae bacterium]|jgi:putative SOS response-associated peptidase YedK|nr:SOS response-associated peptidase [Paracoccaceae bacterium]